MVYHENVIKKVIVSIAMLYGGLNGITTLEVCRRCEKLKICHSMAFLHCCTYCTCRIIKIFLKSLQPVHQICIGL